MKKKTVVWKAGLALIPLCFFMISLSADDMPPSATGSSPAQSDTSGSSSQDTGCQPQMALKPNNPNDPTSPPRAEDGLAEADEIAEDMPSQGSNQAAQTVTGAITANPDGTMLTLDNGMIFAVPKALKKKAMHWTAGDKVTMEKGKRDNWYRLVNTTRGETIRARLQQPSTPQQ